MSVPLLQPKNTKHQSSGGDRAGESKELSSGWWGEVSVGLSVGK